MIDLAFLGGEGLNEAGSYERVPRLQNGAASDESKRAKGQTSGKDSDSAEEEEADLSRDMDRRDELS